MVKLSKRVEKYIDVEEFLKTKDSSLTDDGYTREKWKRDGLDMDQGKKPKPSQ